MSRTKGAVNKPKSAARELARVKKLYKDRGLVFPGDAVKAKPRARVKAKPAKITFDVGARGRSQETSALECGNCHAILEAKLPECPHCHWQLSWED